MWLVSNEWAEVDADPNKNLDKADLNVFYLVLDWNRKRIDKEFQINP